MDPYSPCSDDTPHLEPLFSLGYRITYDNIIYKLDIQLGYGRQYPFYDIDGHIVRPVKTELPPFGLADCRTVSGNNVRFLHKNGLVVYATVQVKGKIFSLKMEIRFVLESEISSRHV